MSLHGGRITHTETPPSFRHTIKFCTVLNNTTVNIIEEQKYLVSATMESLYGSLKQDRMLSEKDANAKTPKITLRLFLYVPEAEEVNKISILHTVV